MKKSITFLFLLLLAVTAGAKTISKIANPTYVGINDGTMKIVSVKTTEEATTVTFQYPGEGFGFFSQKTYLVDEQGEYYNMIGQKGFSEDSLKRLVPKKKGKYELRFKPLPEGTRIFDLIEDFYHIGGSKFYGIREAGAPFSVTSPKSHNEGEASLPDIDFEVDSVSVTGRIVNYNPNEDNFKKVLRFSVYAAEYGKKDSRWPYLIASIKEDGTFQAKVRVVGPTWTYLMLAPQKGLSGSRFIPVMLYPDDHIELQIRIGDENAREEVTYASKLKRDFSNLMQCAPMIHVNMDCTPTDGKDYSDDYGRMTLEGIQQSFDDYDSMGLYLSGKYGLTRLETEMLRSHLSLVKAIDVVGLTNRYLLDLHEKDVPAEEQKAAHENWKKSDSPYYALSFSNVRAESNTFLTTPYWTVLLSTHNMNHIAPYNKRTFDFWLYKHSTILNKEIGTPEAGEPISYRSSSEVEKRKEEFEKRETELYHNWVLELIRDWRNKGKNDLLFEQAYLLCCTRDMGPRSLPYDLSNIFSQFSQSRALFQHPSIVRMAGELLRNREKECYQTEEDFLEGKRTSWNKTI